MKCKDDAPTLVVEPTLEEAQNLNLLLRQIKAGRYGDEKSSLNRLVVAASHVKAGMWLTP